jgi:hypothetical protein
MTDSYTMQVLSTTLDNLKENNRLLRDALLDVDSMLRNNDAIAGTDKYLMADLVHRALLATKANT